MNGQIVIWDLQDWKKASSHLLSGGYSHAAAFKKNSFEIQGESKGEIPKGTLINM
jgi:hypothetical protein